MLIALQSRKTINSSMTG